MALDQINLISPVNLDAIVKAKNTTLASNLDWLDRTYGIAYPVKENDGQIKPKLYVSGNNEEQYLNLFSDDLIGNYCFWLMAGEEKTETLNFRTVIAKAPLELIFFFKYDSVFNTNDTRYTVENVKELIRPYLLGPVNGKFEVKGIETRPEKVWSSLNIKSRGIYQYRPYGAIKFKIEITYKSYQSC